MRDNSFRFRTSIRLVSCALVALLLLPFAACTPSEPEPADPPLTESQVARYTLASKAFGGDVAYMVYLPEGYSADQRYPVWYAMHGYSSTEKMWLSDAGVGKVADDLIAEGTLAPMIMVFPYSRYDDAKTIETDLADGTLGPSRMERFLCDELIPYIDAHYSTIASTDGRFIGGFSMGGLFALQIGLHQPTLFSKIGAYSPALTYRDFGDDHFERWLSLDTDEATQFEGYAKRLKLDKIAVYLDCGDESDPFSEGAASLYNALTARGIAAEFHPHAGGHTLQKDLLEGYLLFYYAMPS